MQPAFAASRDFDGVAAEGRVRSVFLHDTVDGFAANIAAREGEEQPRRAQISWSYSEWLRAECEDYGLPTIHARPWAGPLDRALAAITSDRQSTSDG